jgi:alpha-tubulin suppressor-like RCC1 family protein
MGADAVEEGDGKSGLLSGAFQEEPQRERGLDGKGVVSVSAGSYWMAAVCASGDLYTWGPPHRGGAEGDYLGHGEKVRVRGQAPPATAEAAAEESSHTPRQVTALEDVPVVAAACGDIQMGCLSREGALYTWGEGDQNGLGHGEAGHRNVPCLVEALRGVRVRHAAFSFGNSGCLDEHGGLYLWGGQDAEQGSTNWATQAGLTATRPSRFTFGGFPREYSLTDVACGHWYTVVCLQETPQLGACYTGIEAVEAPEGLSLETVLAQEAEEAMAAWQAQAPPGEHEQA